MNAPVEASRRQLLDRISQLSIFQRNLFTRAQAVHLGVGEDQLAEFMEDGTFELFELEATDQSTSRPDDTFIWTRRAAFGDEDLWAALLKTRPEVPLSDRLRVNVKPDVVISHESACTVLGVGVFADEQPTFTAVPGEAAVVLNRPAHVRLLHPSRDLRPEHWLRAGNGLLVTTPVRTLGDLLDDGAEPAHIAAVAADVADRYGLSRLIDQGLEESLNPHRKLFGVADGAAVFRTLCEISGRSASDATVVNVSKVDRSIGS